MTSTPPVIGTSTHQTSGLVPPGQAAGGEENVWMARFRDGDPAVLQQIYQDHFATVDRAAAGLGSRVDRETSVFELFSRLLADADLRASYRGDGLEAWLEAITRRQTADFMRCHWRRGGRPGDEPDPALVDLFRREVLPPHWGPVFEARFLRQLPRAQAAEALGISRLTLYYREARVRRLLRWFLCSPGETSF